jgi:hypothetical protein
LKLNDLPQVNHCSYSTKKVYEGENLCSISNIQLI